MDPSAIELKFPFTFADRLRAGLAITLTCWTCLVLTLVPSVVGIALLVVSFSRHGSISTKHAVLAALLLAYMPFMILWNTWRAHKTYADTPVHTYTFSGEGVRSRSAHTELMQDWTVIQSVRVRSDFLMLYFSNRCAHCIPLRWLDPAQLGAVAALARAGQVQRVEVP